jgi:putative ABC transport system permease protein
MNLFELKSFFNYLKKNRLYTLITLSGFAISLMFVLLLSVYIKQELGVDRFHEKRDRIYRLVRGDDSGFAPPVGERIMNDYPEVEAYTKVYPYILNSQVAGGEQIRTRCLMIDPAFFNIFSFSILEGEPDHLLATSRSVVLTSSFALKQFGNIDPAGQVISINKLDFIVTGIIEDIRKDSHIEGCDILLNFELMAEIWGWQELLTSYGNSSFTTYFLARENSDLPSKAPQILESFQEDYWIFTRGYSHTLSFEPLVDVYFSRTGGQAIRQNSRTTVSILGGIALLILVIAIINYINLTVAQAGFRSKETAIKRLHGSSRNALLMQHIAESVMLTFVAALIAVMMAFSFEPFFNFQMESSLDLGMQFTPVFIMFAFLLILLTGVISGIFPAIVASRFNPVDVVKGALARKTKSTYSRVLIAFQYVIAIVLMISTWTISSQSKFLQNYNLGFNTENLFWMDNTIEGSQREAFRHELKSIPGVEEVTYTRGTPMDGGNNQSFSYKDKPLSFQEFVVDSLFFELMGMNVKPTEAAFTSRDGAWLNRKAIQELELEDDAIVFPFYDNEVTLLGIIDDFNFRSLYTDIGPLIVRQLPENHVPWSILVKIDGSDLVATVHRIKEVQHNFTGGIPMESGFVDTTINQWYSQEVKRSRLIGAFTLLSIIISSMGIFAMSMYFIQQKVKEIGIRKVNGARAWEVVSMLNMDFIRWVAIAFVIAGPIAWFAMSRWLENFAYRIELKWWVFGLAGIIALSIALLTVSWQSWKAARRNPVEALRYE